MKIMKQPCVAFLLGMIAIFSASDLRASTPVSIIPAPANAELREGKLLLPSGSRIIADPDCQKEAEMLAARLRPATGFAFEIAPAKTKPAAGDIQLKTEGADSRLGAEGYELSVSPDGVVVRAGTAAGIFYGTQSLLQLLPPEIFSSKPAEGVAWTIPCVEISDSPRFPWRGFMLDVSRHFFSKDEVKAVLDWMALYKLNTFHWHLTDDQGWRIQIDKYPKLTEVGAWREGIGFDLDPKSSTAYDHLGRYGGYYTKADIREVVAYAAARHITVVPEIEMPGHSSAAITAYPEFACETKKNSLPATGADYNGVYCAGNDKTFAFLGDVLSEVAELFPGKFIHIGGDEVPKSRWENCARCQSRVQTEGLKSGHELQSDFIRRIEKIVNSCGKRLIGWSEIREGGLAPRAALMDWIGGGAESAASGHDVVMAPTTHGYLDYRQSEDPAVEPLATGGYLPLSKVYEFDPVPENLAAEFHSRVLGGQANLWTERVPNLHQAGYRMFPRLGALAEAVWSPKGSRDWSGFEARVAVNEKRLDAMGVNYFLKKKRPHDAP